MQQRIDHIGFFSQHGAKWGGRGTKHADAGDSMQAGAGRFRPTGRPVRIRTTQGDTVTVGNRTTARQLSEALDWRGAGPRAAYRPRAWTGDRVTGFQFAGQRAVPGHTMEQMGIEDDALIQLQRRSVPQQLDRAEQTFIRLVDPWLKSIQKSGVRDGVWTALTAIKEVEYRWPYPVPCALGSIWLICMLPETMSSVAADMLRIVQSTRFGLGPEFGILWKRRGELMLLDAEGHSSPHYPPNKDDVNAAILLTQDL